jgi:hypothetical protein
LGQTGLTESTEEKVGCPFAAISQAADGSCGQLLDGQIPLGVSLFKGYIPASPRFRG